MTRTRSNLRNFLVPRLLEEQRWRCVYCLSLLSNSRSKRNKDNYATLEHVKARSSFRTKSAFCPIADSYENTVVACARCNHLKGTIDAYLFYEQELWRPENAWRLKLHHLTKGFHQYKSTKTLRRMEHYCACR